MFGALCGWAGIYSRESDDWPLFGLHAFQVLQLFHLERDYCSIEVSQ